MMLKAVCNKLLMFFYFIISALIIEAVTFFVLDFSSLPTYFWYNFVLILFVALVVYAIPNYTAQYTIYTIILFVQTAFAYLNYSLLNIFTIVFPTPPKNNQVNRLSPNACQKVIAEMPKIAGIIAFHTNIINQLFKHISPKAIPRITATAKIQATQLNQKDLPLSK